MMSAMMCAMMSAARRRYALADDCIKIVFGLGVGPPTRRRGRRLELNPAPRRRFPVKLCRECEAPGRVQF
jgi:hypothetical protein